MSEAYQEGMFLPFKGYMIKPQKRPNTEPQSVPEADDGLSGKLIQFSTISMNNNGMNSIGATLGHFGGHFKSL